MPEIRFSCFACQKEMVFIDSVGRREECPYCGADAHVCKNCALYDRHAYNECRESSAEVVREKERSNYCDWFTAGTGGGLAQAQREQQVLSAAEALFKKK